MSGAGCCGESASTGAGADGWRSTPMRDRLAGALSADLVINKPLAAPTAPRVQRRISTHQSGRQSRDADRHHRLDQRVLRPCSTTASAVRPSSPSAVAFTTGAADLVATDGKYYIAAARSDRRHNLESIQLLHLRTLVRAGDRASCPPMPARSARCAVRSTPLPRSLQPRRISGTGLGKRSADAAGNRSISVSLPARHYLGVFC